MRKQETTKPNDEYDTNFVSFNKLPDVQMLGYVKAPSVHFSSKTNEWATPQDFYDKLDDEFHFTLDPCANDDNHKTDRYFTEKDDGLAQSWDNETVFMNPPYGRVIGDWVKKASEAKATVVCLIPARTDTRYWHDYVIGRNAEVRFIRGRLKFGGHSNSAPFPSAVVIFRGVYA